MRAWLVEGCTTILLGEEGIGLINIESDGVGYIVELPYELYAITLNT
jgi:hypothetical protein